MGLSTPFAAVASDPFAPSQQTGPTPFGFSIPSGDPDQISQAGKSAGLIGLDWQNQASQIQQGVHAAIEAWSGPAEEAFRVYAAALVSLIDANGLAAVEAAAAMQQLSEALSSAQSRCRAALADCERAQSTLGNAPSGGDAVLSTAAHRQADQAQDDLNAAKRQGTQAADDYEQTASALARRIAAAESDLTALPSAGGIPVPVNGSTTDLNAAKKLFSASSDFNRIFHANSWSYRERLAVLDGLNGGPMTPGEIQIYTELLDKWRREPTGSLIDEFGGLFSVFTGHLIRFGNSHSLEYKAGEIIGSLPVDPDADFMDGVKGIEAAAKVLSNEGGNPSVNNSPVPDIAEKDLPENVQETLHRIDEKGSSAPNTRGGGAWGNKPNLGAQRLPTQEPDGTPITYTEWDTTPKVRGTDRTSERLVIGSDGSVYYTTDHYFTFRKVR